MVTNLMRQAWDRKAKGMGLRACATASGSMAWYVPSGLIPSDQITFKAVGGQRRRKKLVGHSKKRGVYWHFALELRPVLNHPRHYAIRTHVIFSLDGVSALPNAAKMHALRRGFCRSWWNDRWRDLTAAYLIFLAAGDDVIEMPVSKHQSVRIACEMTRLVSPVSFHEPQSVEILDDDADLDIDAEDDLFLTETLAELEFSDFGSIDE